MSALGGPARTILLIAVLVHLLAWPALGRLAWRGMSSLHGAGQPFAAVAVSLLVAGGIFAANALLARAAYNAGAPKGAVAALWIAAVLTFGITIGFGFFSPVDLLIAVLLS